MNRTITCLIALCLGCHYVSSSAWADNIGGAPRADFSINELRIPCVLVKNLTASTNDKFFDVILKRQSDSFIFELKFVEGEDKGLCQRISDFAEFEDDDFVDDSKSGGSDDSNTGNSNAKILVRCEKRSDRSKISVNGNNLQPGNYSSEVNSGGNMKESPLKATVGDEVEYDYDSDNDDILAGAIKITPGFIQGNTVTAKIINDSDNVVVEDTVTCLIK